MPDCFIADKAGAVEVLVAVVEDDRKSGSDVPGELGGRPAADRA
ncbi:hypothetical protein [Candidatus Amarobacter glycogenicus]